MLEALALGGPMLLALLAGMGIAHVFNKEDV